MRIQEFIKHLTVEGVGKFIYYDNPGADRTIMISRHIWWCDCMAHGFYQQGFNVLLSPAFYLYYNPDDNNKFDAVWDSLIAEARKYNVDMILGGNTTAILHHPRTGEMFHEALDVPLINWWWDEPRKMRYFGDHGMRQSEYIKMLKSPMMLNVFQDKDILEEMQRDFQINNSCYVPVGTTPEYWPARQIPIERRKIDICFVGNSSKRPPPFELQDPIWSVVDPMIDAKCNHLDQSVMACVDELALTTDAVANCFNKPLDLTDDAAIENRFKLWRAFNYSMVKQRRIDMLQLAGEHYGDKMHWVGKGWDAYGFTTQAQNAGHSGGPGRVYTQAKASLNFFGGSVHGGLPLRAFDIAASNGLVVTAYNRDLPNFFEPDQECLAFKTADQMIEQIDRVLHEPAAFTAMAAKAKLRVAAEHTWTHRAETLIGYVDERFGDQRQGAPRLRVAV